MMQVVAAAAQTLCALGRLNSAVRARFTAVLQWYTARLVEFSAKLESPGAPDTQKRSNVAHTCRWARAATLACAQGKASPDKPTPNIGNKHLHALVVSD